ncbi:MAG: hypothetical protein ACW99G_01270 [Candidatus Thorarchaeota archaeon]|jgi:hypothetical protein
MPILEYRMNLLEMGTFTCIAVGDGGIIMGGCSIYGFAIGVVIPRHCFKFDIGDKAYLKTGKATFIVKAQTKNGTNFYQVDCYGRLYKLPESELFYLSEVIDCASSGLLDIEAKLDKLANIPIIIPDTPGKRKIPAKKKFDTSAIRMLRDKFLIQLDKLEEKPQLPEPAAGVKKVPIETGFDVGEIRTLMEVILDKLEYLKSKPQSPDPSSGAKKIPIDFGISIDELQVLTNKLLLHLDNLESKPELPDPAAGIQKILLEPGFDISEMQLVIEKLLDQLDNLESKPELPDPAAGKKAFITLEFGTTCPDLEELKEDLQEKLKELQDCIDNLPPPDGELIFPEQDLHITTMEGGIRMGGCAYVVPPAGHCFCD